MENQLHIPKQLLPGLSDTEISSIQVNVVSANILLGHFYSKNHTNNIKLKDVEYLVYLLEEIEKVIYPYNSCLAELSKILIMKQELFDYAKKMVASGDSHKSDILYPITEPVGEINNIEKLLEYTLYGSVEEIIFKPIKDLAPMTNCIVYKIQTNDDFYYYDSNKGFVGTPVATNSVTEELVKRTQYIKKLNINPKEKRRNNLTVNVIGEPNNGSLFLIINDEYFTELKIPLNNEILNTRYNIFSILKDTKKDIIFNKQRAGGGHGVLSDIYAREQVLHLVNSLLLKNTFKNKKIAIINTLTDIFYKRMNINTVNINVSAETIQEPGFFYKNQHVYMIFTERIYNLVANFRGITNESTIGTLVNIICADETSNYLVMMSELKK